MLRYLTLHEVLRLHERVLEQSGGATGIRDYNGLASAVALPKMTFAGKELYQTIYEKAGVLGYALINNHPFVDGNKRVGHLAMELFLLLNGLELYKSVDYQEKMIIQVASGEIERDEFTKWIELSCGERTDF